MIKPEKMDDKVFFAKILLFGEYSLLAGSRALTIPFRDYAARWRFIQDMTESVRPAAYRSNQSLSEYLLFLESLPGNNDMKQTAAQGGPAPDQFAEQLNLTALKHDIERGIFLDSSIPTGYGMGSSGALVASVYDRYGSPPSSHGAQLQASEWIFLKNLFSVMEAHFHGTSSGIDPLSCYLAQPLLLASAEEIMPVTIPACEQGFRGGFFLLDTGRAAQTGPLVKGFMRKCQEPWFEEFLRAVYIPVVDGAINALRDRLSDELYEWMYMLSGYQLRHFHDMIPPACVPLWEQGLHDGLFSLKLCGSGGGGFLLGYTMDYAAAEEAMLPHALRRVTLG
jgi:mevalonate kinase